MARAAWLAAIVAGSMGIASGCGDDDGGTPRPDGGPADGGSLTDANGDDAGSSPDAGSDSGMIDEDGGVADCTPRNVLVTTSDYVSGGLGFLDTTTDTTRVAASFDESDAVPAAIGCSPVVIARSSGEVRFQSREDPLVTERTIDVDPEGTTTPYASNPQTVVQVADDKAYVISMARNQIVVIDPRAEGAAGIRGMIDLSPFVAPEDTDGLVDAVDAILVGGHVYVALGRYWFDDTFAIHFAGSVLAVIDTAIDAAMPDPIELNLENPWRGMAQVGFEIWIGSSGDSFALDGGIEKVDWATNVATGVALFEADAGAELEGFVVVSETRVVTMLGGELKVWNPTTFAIDPAPIATGVNGVLGVGGSIYAWSRQGEGAGLTRYDAASGAETGGPWTFGTLPILAARAVP